MRLRLQIPLLLTLLLAPAAARPQSATTSSDPWYNHAVIYEIYPRSFQDSNGDGIGDLNGITQRLDYLQTLGVDAIWISPMYPSPQVDFGYDISNYTAVDPQYGTLADFDRLLAAAKTHHIRIVLDMVLNHTSDKHQWFIDSASSRTNPTPTGTSGATASPPPTPMRSTLTSPNGRVVPPNNWVSLFGGSAWEWVPAARPVLLSQVLQAAARPQLAQPRRRKSHVRRHALLARPRRRRLPSRRHPHPLRRPAAPRRARSPRPASTPTGDPDLNDIYTNVLPEVHDVLRRMRADDRLTIPTSRVLIGETYLPNTAELLKWYGDPAAHRTPAPHGHARRLPHRRRRPHRRPQRQLNASPLPPTPSPRWKPRPQRLTSPSSSSTTTTTPAHWDRFGDDATPENKLRIAKLIATILYTTRSTALTYYGAEIGMTTHTPTRKEDVRDPIGITGWPKEKGRDGERTPMQWTPNPPAAGFSTNPHTWLPIGADYPTVNVQSETGQPDTLLTWTHDLIDLRRGYPALHARRHRHARHQPTPASSPTSAPPPPGQPMPTRLHLRQLHRPIPDRPPQPRRRRPARPLHLGPTSTRPSSSTPAKPSPPSPCPPTPPSSPGCNSKSDKPSGHVATLPNDSLSRTKHTWNSEPMKPARHLLSG